MKHLSWLLTLPLMAVAVIFAVNHRQPVVLDLWPFPIQVDIPLYLLTLLGIFVGFLIGGAVMWGSQRRHRRRMRAERRRADELAREVEALQRRLDQHEGPGAGRVARTNTGRSRLVPRTPSLPSLPGARR